MKVKFENGRYYVEPTTSDEEGFAARCVLHNTNVRLTIDPAQEAIRPSRDQFPLTGIGVGIGSGSALGGGDILAGIPRN